MRYSRIQPESEISLKSTIRSGATPAKAIHEAIEFVKEHRLSSVTLNYYGFTMNIDSDSDLSRLVREFNEWRDIQNEIEQ